MDLDKLDKEIKEIIRETFSELFNIQNKTSQNRLIFPNYNNGTIRVSEQELRFLFIEKLNDILEKENLYYSIETPTEKKYKFTEGRKDICPICDEENGQSANFDLVIFDSNRETRLALIEFKAKNASAHSHAKDFCKLGNEKEGNDATLRYFIEILEKSDDKTIKNLREKKILKNKWVTFELDYPITIACYSLSDKDWVKLSDDSNYFYQLEHIEKNSNSAPFLHT